MALSIDLHSRSQNNRFTAVRLDRLVEYRDDAQWVQAALTAEDAHYVPLWRSRSLLDRDDQGTLAVYLRPAELEQSQPAAASHPAGY